MRGARKSVLKFGLVTAPVALAPARKRQSGRGGISLKFVTEDGRPVKQRYVTEEGESFSQGELAKGVERGDSIVVIDAEKLNEIDEATKLDEIEILGFIPAKDVPMDRIIDAHFIQPQTAYPPDALALVIKAMKRRKRAAVVRFTLAKGQKPGAVVIRDDGALVLYTLTPASCLVEPDDEVMAPSEVKVKQAQVALAIELVDRLSRDDKGREYGAELFDEFEDERANRYADLIEDVLEGKSIESVEVPAADDADLAEKLAASVGA